MKQKGMEGFAGVASGGCHRVDHRVIHHHTSNGRMNFFSIESSSVIVWHDEIDLDKGKIKVKWGGGHGGHNGIRDIISHIGNDFWRIRIGIGRPTNNIPPSKWVLSSFHRNDFNEWLNELLSVMANETEFLHNNNSVEFMNKVAINTNKQKGNS